MYLHQKLPTGLLERYYVCRLLLQPCSITLHFSESKSWRGTKTRAVGPKSYRRVAPQRGGLANPCVHRVIELMCVLLFSTTRLAQERHEAAEKIQSPGVNHKVKLVESMKEAGVENFHMKAAVPGTEIPGHKVCVCVCVGIYLLVFYYCTRLVPDLIVLTVTTPMVIVMWCDNGYTTQSKAIWDQVIIVLYQRIVRIRAALNGCSVVFFFFNIHVLCYFNITVLFSRIGLWVNLDESSQFLISSAKEGTRYPFQIGQISLFMVPIWREKKTRSESRNPVSLPGHHLVMVLVVIYRFLSSL